MRGHIALAGREYMLASERAITRSNANQVAAKIHQGAGEYDDLENWSNWLMNDWRGGGGRKDPTAGGFLFSTADTRFSGQMSLPGFLLHKTFGVGVFPSGSASISYELATSNVSVTPHRHDVTIGADQAVQEVGWVIEFFSQVPTLIEIWLPGVDPGCTSVVVSVYSSTGNVPAGVPGTLVESKTVTLNGRPGHHWYAVKFDNIVGDISDPVFNVIAVRPATGTLTLPATELSAALPGDLWQRSGSIWIASKIGLMSRAHHTESPFGAVSKMVWFNNRLYMAIGARLMYFDPASISGFETLATMPATITDLMSTGDRLYVGCGSGQNYRHMNTGHTITAASVPAQKFLLWRGFLWRSVGVNLFYTGDETNWTLIELADRGYQIRGLGGYGDDVIVSTDNALYRVTWGDLVQELTTWGAISATNGAVMHQFQGDLYITLGPSLLRYDGNLLPIGPDLGEGLAEHYAGSIIAMTSNNNWLLCAIAGDISTIWIYNGQGWHFATALPDGVGVTLAATSIIYTVDDTNGFSEFLVSSAGPTIHSFRIADTLTAMRRMTDATTGTQYHAWSGFLESDWFYGNLREVLKDVESVYVDGEHLGGHGESHASVYWMDEESTGWEMLGHINEDEQELRFIDPVRRPAAHRIRLGVLLYNNFHLHTPVISAVRLKFRPMIRDRWRWQFPVLVHDNQQMLDGGKNTQTAAQMVAHLDEITKQVPPFVFRDIDGQQYEVIVLNAPRQVDKLEWLPHAGRAETHLVYQMTIEQVVSEAIPPEEEEEEP